MRPTSWLLVAFLSILARDAIVATITGKPVATTAKPSPTLTSPSSASHSTTHINDSTTVTPTKPVNSSSSVSPHTKAHIGLSTTTSDFPTEAPTSTSPTSTEWTPWGPLDNNETEPTSNYTDATTTAELPITTKTEASSTSESSSSSPTSSSPPSTSKSTPKPVPPPIPTTPPRSITQPSTETTTEDEDEDEDSGWVLWLCILLPILGCIVGVTVVFFLWRKGKKKEAEKEKAEMMEKQKEKKKKKEKKGGVEEGKGEKKSEKTEKSTPSEPILPAGVPAAKATKTAKAKKNSTKKPKKGKSKFEPPPPGSQPRFFIPAKDIKFMGPLVMQPRHVGSFTHEDDKEEHSEVKPFKEIVIDKDMMVAYEIGDGVEKFKTDDGSDSTEEMSEYFKDYDTLQIGPVVPSKGVKGRSAAKSTR